MKQKSNRKQIVRGILFILLCAIVCGWNKLEVKAINIDVAQVQESDDETVYRITKGTSVPLSFTIQPQTETYVDEYGNIQYETVYPEITKVKNTQPGRVSYENGILTAIEEGSATIKLTYQFCFHDYTIIETALARVRVVAYSRSGNTFIFHPDLLTNQDITYSFIDASVQARELATDEDHYAIQIPGGNYVLSDVIHLYSNITIDLAEDTVITTTAPSGTNMFLLGTTGEYAGEADYNESALCAGYNGFRNVTIRGGKLVGNDKSKSCLIRMAHATNVCLENVTFSGGAGAHQVEVAAIDGFTVKNCVFRDFYGIKGVTGNYEALQLDIPCAKSPYEGAYADGTTMKNVEITGCTFKNLSKGLGTHTMLIGAYHESIKINQNVFSNITNEAIICLNYYICEIKDNVMKDCGAGIEFEYYLPNSYCIYNTIFEGTKEYKKGIRHRAEAVISGNKMTINYHTGYVGCTGINIYGYNRTNSIVGAAGNTVKAKDYFVSGVTVSDNTIVTAGYGIRLQNAKKCIVTDNVISGKDFSIEDAHIKAGNTYDGIYMTRSSSAVELSGNKIKNMNGGGIYLSQSVALNGILNNTITGVKRYGIYLYQGSKARTGIVGNTIKSTSEAEALIYLNTESKIKHNISNNTLTGYKNNAAIKVDLGKFLIVGNTISRVSEGALMGAGATGSIYENDCSSKAASLIRFEDKNYHMASAVQTKLKAKEGMLTPEYPDAKGIKGYEIRVSKSKKFDKDVLVYRVKKDNKGTSIMGLENGKKYYVRVYTFKNYNGVNIYKTE